jgi:SAM-dependent methyltransferase
VFWVFDAIKHVMNNAPKFDDYADDYDEALARGISVSGENKDYFARGRVAWLARRVAEIGFMPRDVLDFGCGTGSATPFLREYFDIEKLVGVDISQNSLKRARHDWNFPNVSFCALSEYARAGDCDLVFCNGVFHHIPPAERAASLTFVRNVLRPGGIFALWENNAWNPATRFVMHRCPFDDDAIPLSPRQARKILKAAGFHVLRTDYQFIFPRALRWLRGLEAPLSRFPFGTQYLVLAQRN